MTRKIQVLVVEDSAANGPKISEMLSGSDWQLHHAESCEQALNKMLEYMDVVIVDSRIQCCTNKTLTQVKSRVATTPVLAACPTREIENVRLGAKVRVDGYLSLDMAADAFNTAVRVAYTQSRRAASAVAPKRGFAVAA